MGINVEVVDEEPKSCAKKGTAGIKCHLSGPTTVSSTAAESDIIRESK